MDRNFLHDVILSSKRRHSLYDICFNNYLDSKSADDEAKRCNSLNTVEMCSPNKTESHMAVKEDVDDCKVRINRRPNDLYPESRRPLKPVEKGTEMSKTCINLRHENQVHTEIIPSNRNTEKNEMMNKYFKSPTIFIPGTTLFFSGLHESDESPKFMYEVKKFFRKISE
ncbi:hypothetical protein WA026_015572 [Henosepilachna vigintioctopunctata]|uniref:Uncharacterized protein n=1 Tax=Henosepilachna vigintioctopunctata TaxID=420089 RepID=A0AAW1V8V8_9CUCU